MFATLLGNGMSRSFLIKLLIGSITVFASLYGVLDHFEQKGYNRAIIEIQGEVNEKIQEANKAAIDKAAKTIQEALNNQQLIHDAELKRVSSERKVKFVTEKVIEDVDQIKIKNDCSTISDDIMGLLNKSINISNTTNN